MVGDLDVDGLNAVQPAAGMSAHCWGAHTQRYPHVLRHLDDAVGARTMPTQ